MKALLLAAGLGTRLKPLTNHLPKCLIPIHGRPLLDYWLEILILNGVDEVLINTHYLAPKVMDFLERSEWKSKTKVVYEENLLGTGGTIIKNRSFFQEEGFLVAHADNLCVFNLKDFEQSHVNRPDNTHITMMIFKTDNPRSCGVVELDIQGVVKAFHEKVESPQGDLANAAVYIMQPCVIDVMEKLGKEKIDFSTDVIPKFIGKIFTYHNNIYNRDIGTLESWIAAHDEFPVKIRNIE
jgi:mannose-1-phosphate guanylyltransferase